LQNDYVVVSLFVDDREALPADQQAKDADGNMMKTKGQLYTNLQITRFNKNAQPYYVLMDENEQVLNTPSPANFNVNEFASFLEDGVKKYKK
jgi:thiol:disulfide interchange protein DsbD